jgi:soluble lytic murein transglycosylase-like protein
MRDAIWIGAAGLLAYGAWTLYQAQQNPQAFSDQNDNPLNDAAQNIVSKTSSIFQLWRPPEKYAPAIAAAEARNGLPPDLLARQLWQESRYRPEIIDGTKRSAVGAIGIAQFMPATAREFGIDPTEPFQSIDAAARYMGQLYRRFGNWTEALAAYNWGQGNVSRKGLAAAPAETRNYYAQILGDVNAANSTDWA